MTHRNTVIISRALANDQFESGGLFCRIQQVASNLGMIVAGSQGQGHAEDRMNLKLIVAIFSAVPIYAQAQKANAVKLKEEAQNVVEIISGDQLKTSDVLRNCRDWVGRIEYRYADFGTLTNLPVITFSGFTESHKITENTVRGGIAYKF